MDLLVRGYGMVPVIEHQEARRYHYHANAVVASRSSRDALPKACRRIVALVGKGIVSPNIECAASLYLSGHFAFPCNPLIPGHEAQPELLVVDAPTILQLWCSAALNCRGEEWCTVRSLSFWRVMR